MGCPAFRSRSNAIVGRVFTALGISLALSVQAVAQAQQSQQAPSISPAWTVPSNDAIRALLDERMKSNGVGIVVGIVGPEGRRLIVHGRSGAPSARPLDGDTIFQIGSVTKVFTTLLLSDMVLKGEVKLD